MAIDSQNKRASAGSLLGLEMLPLADGTVGTPDRLQIAGLYVGIPAAGASAFTWTPAGGVFLYTRANWKAVDFHLEAYLKALAGVAYVHLKSITTSTVLPLSQINTAEAGYTRVRSDALTLVDGNEYEVELGVAAGDSGNIRSTRLVVIK